MSDQTLSGRKAEEALSLAQAEPGRAVRLASSALANELPPVSRARALWALGLARRELDDLPGSTGALEEAITAARGAGEAVLGAEISSSLAWSLARLGDLEQALELTRQAAPHLRDAPAARNQMQQGLIFHRLGRNRDALSSYAAALAGLEAAGDLLAAARLRLNRSVVHVYAGTLDEAAEDLEQAYRTAVDQGQTLLEAACAHNLAFTEGRRGDIPSSLQWFEVAERAFGELDSRQRSATLRSDRAEVYAEAGLLRDALADAEAAVADLRAEDDAPALADALLLLARVAQLAGDASRASTSAREARHLFASQGRGSWELLASYLETMATLHRPEDEADPGKTLNLVVRLESEHWEREARRLRLEAARTAFDRGDTAATIRLLEGDPGHAATSGSDQVALAEARYLLATARGEEREAGRSIRRGLDILDRYRAGIGSPEVRAGMARHGVRLVEAAVDRAMGAGDPWRVFQAVDTWRARSMDFPPALPPDDTELAAALSELRRIESDLRDAAGAGEDTTELLVRRRRIETRVQRITRRMEARTAGVGSPPGKMELGEALEERALLSFFLRRGTIHAVWFEGRRWRMDELAPRTRVAHLVDELLFALHRLATGRGSPASLEAAANSLQDTGTRLSEILIEPIHAGDGPLVVIPTGILHRLPWHALPALSGRAVSVAPSARAWLRAFRQGLPPGRAALVAGPDLPGGRTEVERLGRLYPAAQQLTGRNATTDRVLSLLDGAAVAHLAAHGTFRTDNPLFSSLRMTDGPLTVYDLERIGTVPPTVVMPSCESALSDVGAGDELLGLAAALLRIGTASLVAPAVTIPDVDTRTLMISLHRRMEAGAEPAAALAEAIATAPGDSPQAIAARAAFVALGA